MLELKKYIALFFITCFIGMICAPTIINSIDNTVDISVFFDYGEEDDHEVLKLTFENESINIDLESIKTFGKIQNIYQIDFYQKPFLNLIFPPPDDLI